MDESDLDRILIRARIVDTWDTRSLRELIDCGQNGQIGAWFISRVLQCVGMEEGAVVTEGAALAMVDFLERNGIRLVRLKGSGD